MENDFITTTAQQMVDAGEYDNLLDAKAALTSSIAEAKEKNKQAIKNMNRAQRRKAGKKVDTLISALERGKLKPSEQFKALPEEDQKKALLSILAKVHEANMKFEKGEYDYGTDETEGN